jgi:hypothetical protein
MSVLHDVVRKIDWELLRAQKSSLLWSGNDLGMGVVELIDALQDAAVEDGLATEAEVFDDAPEVLEAR